MPRQWDRSVVLCVGDGVQGVLGVADLLLQSLLHAGVGALLQQGLHVGDAGAVTRHVVEDPDGAVAAAHQESVVNVEFEVGDVLAVDVVELLLQLTRARAVHANVSATRHGDRAAVRRQGDTSPLRYLTGHSPQQVRVLLLLVLHIRVPELPRAVFRHSHHPAATHTCTHTHTFSTTESVRVIPVGHVAHTQRV